MSDRTELWEAPKGSDLTGHVAFSVEDDEHVRLPYTMLASILQTAGLRRKLSTPHGPRLSLHPADPPAPAPAVATGVPADHRPPPGYRWLTRRECHRSDDYCDMCRPGAPERRVTRLDG